MRRLIDANEITYHEVKATLPSPFLMITTKANIDAAPTIEAIPIEWIWNKWLRRKKQRWVDTDAFIDLINDWRKENGRS